MEHMQQMQVTVPDGVFPGMPFQVETPTGPMQVTAPPGSQPGGQMLVNVPAAPVVVVAAMPVADAAPVSVSAAAMPVADAAPVSVSAAVVSAPHPQQMSGTVRLDDIQDGWYGLEGCPTCCCMRIAFNHDKSAFSQGPCCCWQLPIPCVIPDRFKAQSIGSITFINGADSYTWVTPTRFLMEQIGNSNHYSKMC